MFEKLDKETWQKYVYDYENRSDGISIANYCRENNLNKNNFFYYRKRLKRNSTIVFESITIKKTEEVTATIKKRRFKYYNSIRKYNDIYTG